MKLGRLPARFDASVPHLMTLNLDPAPPVVDRFTKVQSWPKLKNDVEGDCTIASAGHIIQLWNTVTKNGIGTMTDAEAEATYSALSGYVPGDESTDSGCVELDVLNYWQQTGMPSDGKTIKLTRFLRQDATSVDQMRAAVYHLGASYIGLNLPDSALKNTNVWDVEPGAQIAGGHAVPIVGYDHPNEMLYTVSWGLLIPMTYRFFQAYCEESWSPYSQDWTFNAAA